MHYARTRLVFCGVVTLILCLAGCPNVVEDVPQMGSEKKITAFSFALPPADGRIDQEALTIEAAVPYGTDLSALRADFVTTGIRVSVGGVDQESGVSVNDFRSPVTYTVTAEDGSTADYVVGVTREPPPSSEKTIEEFAFLVPAVAGLVDQQALRISLVVPHGTDRSSLVAVLTTTGGVVTVNDTEQESGRSVNDFTDPVVYVVTAEDGSTAEYTVTVDVAPSTDKALTAFSFLGFPSPCLIDQAAGVIRVRVPETADLASLLAVFTTTGMSVSLDGVEQQSGAAANDFRTPRTYIVTAEDGSTAFYQVRVTGAFSLVVNEIDYDQPGSDAAELIELYAGAETDLGGVALVLVNGGSIPGQEYDRIDLAPAGTLPAGGFLVIAGSGVSVPAPALKLQPPGWDASNKIQNGPRDAVLLWDTIGGRLIDTVTYNGVLHQAAILGEAVEVDPTEGTAGAPADSGSAAGSVARLPSGSDTGQNGTDFRFTSTLTPGAANR